MDNNNPIKYSDLISPDDSLEKLVKQLDEISSALQFVQKSAVSLNESMRTMSGSTSEGRNAIAAASKEAEKLAKAQQELAFAESETAKKIAELKEATREQNNMNKLAAKEANSAAGSYNALSAQYSRLKMILNTMSEEERKNTVEGRRMVKQAEELYEKMNELQKVTGKYTLQVGNYELAGKSLRTELREVTNVLQQMKLRGEDNTKQYAELIEKAGQLRDAMDDTNSAIKNTASDTSDLDAMLGAASATTGGFAIATSAMSMFGASTESVEKAQKKLQEAIALVNGVQAVANALNKDSALRVKINALSQKLLAKQTQATAAATEKATFSMRGFKAALISTGIGALLVALGFVAEKLIAMKDASDDAAESVQNLDERSKKAADDLKQSYENLANARESYNSAVRSNQEEELGYEEIIKNINSDIKAQEDIVSEETKTLEAYTRQVGKAKKAWEDAKEKFRIGAGNTSEEDVKEAKANYDELAAAVNEINAKIIEANAKAEKSRGDLAKAEKKHSEDEAKAAEKARQDSAKAAEKARQEEEKREQNRISAQNEISQKIRANEKASLEAMKGDEEAYYTEQTRLLGKWSQEEIDQETERYNKQLAEMEKSGLTKEQIETLHNANMLNIHLQYISELQKADDQYNAYLDSQDQKTKQALKEKSIRDLEAQRSATELEIEQMKGSEEKKAKLRLEAELDYQEKRLKLAQEGIIEMSEAEVSQLKIQILKLKKDISQETKADSVWDLMGFSFTSEEQQALDTAIKSATNSVKEYTQSIVDLKTASVESARTRVESAKKALDAEIEARNQGLANNVETAQKELENAKKVQDKALAEQKKAQRAKALIDSAEQTSSLITASANIWKAWGTVPAVAISSIALMWSSFLASKIKAAQVSSGNTETYGDGTVEMLQGGSHYSGNDIDLGSKPDGTRRRAEGGEYFAVINKRSSRKYRSVIPDVVKSLNNDTFASKFLSANSKMGGIPIVVNPQSKTDLKFIEKNIKEIKDQNVTKTFIDGRGNLVRQSKGFTQIIHRR